MPAGPRRPGRDSDEKGVKRRRSDGRNSRRTELDGIEQLCTATAQLSLDTARKQRAAEASLYTTLLVPTTSELQTAADMREMDAAAHVRRWATIVIAMVDDTRSPAKAQAVLREHVEASQDGQALEGTVTCCTVAPTYASDRILKIRFCVASELRAVSLALTECLTAAGAEAKHGAPPRGASERAVAAALTAVRRG